MYELDTTSISALIQTMLRLVIGSLRLDPAAFLAAFDGGLQATPVLIWIVLIGGFSLTVGQSVVLFANRVSRTRFAISLVLGSLKFFLDVSVIVLVMWVMANILSEQTWRPGQIGRMVALANAPYWLSFFFLIPYAGLIWERLTKFYVLLTLITAIEAVFGVTFFSGLLVAFPTLVISEVISLLLGRLLSPLSNRIQNKLVGDVEMANTQKIYALFTKRDLNP